METTINEPPTLQVSVEGATIILSRGQEVPDHLWREVTSWWSSVALEVSSSSVKIPTGEFRSRRRWIVAYWRDFGRAVVVAPQVKHALDEVNSQLETFGRLAFSGYGFENEDVNQRLNFPRPLTRQQEVNVRNLLRAPSGANFSVPGAGKTATELAVFHLLNQEEQTQLLVICPKSSFEAWAGETQTLFNDQTMRIHILDEATIRHDTKIVLVNYEQLENPEKLRRLQKWMANYRTILVLDEAHRVKGGGASVRWRACRALAGAAFRVDLLTGTPMPQGFGDLRNLFTLSWPLLPNDALSDESLRKIKPGGLFVRTTKSQLGLPPVEIQRISVKMNEVQKEIYSGLVASYDGLFKATSGGADALRKKGKAVMTLIAAASNPGLVYGRDRDGSFLDLEWPPRIADTNMDILSVVDNYAKYEMPAKYLWLARYLETVQAEGRKVLVWSSFVGNLQGLSRALYKFNPALIHGSHNQEERQQQLIKFRTDPSCLVLLTNPQTLGEGISLHKDCHEAIFLDRTFNAGHYLQALDRIHRLGLTPDTITKTKLLEAEGTIDVVVANRLELKISRLARMLEDASLVEMSLPDEEQDSFELVGIDNADLDEIFAHLSNIRDGS